MTTLINLLRNLRSPLVLIVASYIGLRALEIALRPQEAFRNRTAHKLMTLSATGLFLLSGVVPGCRDSWRIWE